VGRKKEKVDEGFGLHIYVFFFCLFVFACLFWNSFDLIFMMAGNQTENKR